MQLVTKDDITEIRDGNKLAGYIDENQSLFGIGNDGYAHLIEHNINENKATVKLKEWKTKQ